MKPVPGPVEGWTFARDRDGHLYTDGPRIYLRVNSIGDLDVEMKNGEYEASIPLAVVRALLADSQPLTVGAFIDGGQVVEFFRLGKWWQCRRGSVRRWVRRWDGAAEWGQWVSRQPNADERTYTCRLVPLADADAPPDSRGPIGGAP